MIRSLFTSFLSAGFLCLFTFTASAQSEVNATTVPRHETIKTDQIDILLMRDIEHMGDSTKHTHHHEPHSSAFKIIHVKSKMVSTDGFTGKKRVLMRIIDPHGHDIYDISSGGGLFMVGGKEVPYTYSVSVDFEKGETLVDFLYKHHKNYRHGLHIIELYIDGKKVGEEHYVIK
jgi:hypothetical protein